MRIFVTGFAVAALAAAPCAWDSDPREPSAIAALFSQPPLSSGAAQSQAVTAQDDALLHEAPHEELTHPAIDG
ncbi:MULTISPECIES: hypothetical protein [unclassified Ensifer]|uniref:hypothetical protein n=1 Tax=unclassified Ensifer TaxID=2633371 RepID=UPI000813A6CE|nr:MULTISPECIES: hypothetical protein [unclassified Ensifer]OCO98465.1 hypothetical protein BBX50_10180 [Ensifer sp. LC11]OCP05601.1 hypothetical protein BC374_24950 [Ensifer sp. LC13]OCP13526.1 hypothetical protein BC362_05050 [Ensifer sp. LC14]OCP30771.1 hypothetical protein BC364_24575 [Ensifer sp. LC499]